MALETFNEKHQELNKLLDSNVIRPNLFYKFHYFITNTPFFVRYTDCSVIGLHDTSKTSIPVTT